MNIADSVRYRTTMSTISNIVTNESIVVEIGANDASFYDCMQCKKWITVDKYGNPDIVADLNGPNTLLPFESQSIDIVICTEVLEHLTMGGPLVKEISRILKPDGKAIISVPNIASLKSRLRVMFGFVPNNAASGDCGHPLGGTGVLVEGNWVAAHVVDFTESRLVAYLLRGGLLVTNVIKMPIAIDKIRLKNNKLLTIPTCLFPRTFSDYVLVVAMPMKLY